MSDPGTTPARVRLSEVEELLEPENACALRRLVRTDRDGPDLSMTWVKLDGAHPRLSTASSTRVYYVLEGSGTFEVGDAPPVEVQADDVVIVPRGVEYGYRGRLTALIVNGPGYQPGDDAFA